MVGQHFTVLFLQALLIISPLIQILSASALEKPDSILETIRIAVEAKLNVGGKEKCHLSRVDAAASTFLNTESFFGNTIIVNETNQSPVMAHTACFNRGSLGNAISDYMEARVCAHVRGFHYIDVSHLDPGQTSSYLFDAFPGTVRHPSPTDKKPSDFRNKKICPCDSMCHEWERGLIHSNMKMVKSIFRTAIDYYWQKRHGELEESDERSKYLDLRKMKTKPFIGINGETYSLNLNGSYSTAGRLEKYSDSMGLNDTIKTPSILPSLPLIPEVAIHYRCGDNLVTHYGFIPFRAYSKIIPQNSTHIYVLAESPERSAKAHMVSRCATIFDALFSYLMRKYPTSIIVILRGHDIYEDLARLTYANITICSVSTFCLWPAVSSDTAAHFPVTKLIAKENITFDYGSSFNWMRNTRDKAIRGIHVVNIPNEALVKMLIAD